MNSLVPHTIQPWEKTPQETSVAFAYFAVYRDIGPARTVAETSKRLRVRSALLHALAKRYNWQERALAFDAHIDRERIAARIEAAREMDDRQAMLALVFQEKVAHRLSTMKDEEVERLSAKDVLDWFVQATKIERAARAAPPAPSPATPNQTVSVNVTATGGDATAAAASESVAEVTETVVRTREEVKAVLANPKGAILDGE